MTGIAEPSRSRARSAHSLASEPSSGAFLTVRDDAVCDHFKRPLKILTGHLRMCSAIHALTVAPR
jgi:hypothetical protein